MEALFTKLAEFRAEVKRLSKIYGDVIPPQIGSVGNRLDSYTKEKGSRSASHADSTLSLNRNCRVCKQLELEGYGERFFEDHISSEVVGCPLWIKMSIDERWDLLHRAKLCGRCLDVETVVGSKAQLFNHFRSCKGPGHDYICEGES